MTGNIKFFAGIPTCCVGMWNNKKYYLHQRMAICNLQNTSKSCTWRCQLHLYIQDVMELNDTKEKEFYKIFIVSLPFKIYFFYLKFMARYPPNLC